MSTHKPQHEQLFDEICNKLNELSQREDNTVNHQDKIDRMQGQIKKFQTELQGSHVELNEKIRSLENLQFTQNDLNQQLKQVMEQLHNERSINTKLNTDLAKSLELCLQLQLEIQGLKTRTNQIQIEERKYSQSLAEKLSAIQHDLELTRALRDETDTELLKAKSTIEELVKQNQSADKKNHDLHQTNEELLQNLNEKDQQIEHLNNELGKMANSFSEVEESAVKQNEVLNNLMQVAESKIVELKIALDKKNLECQDYYSHLQQALTQAGLHKQENANLKDYINKVNVYMQQQQQLAQNTPSTTC